MEIEKKLIQYLDLRAQKYFQDKCGVMWIFMQNKCLKFAELLRIIDFEYSPTYISDTLRLNKKVGINFHGEANDMTGEERWVIVSVWSNDFYAKIMEVDTTPE